MNEKLSIEEPTSLQLDMVATYLALRTITIDARSRTQFPVSTEQEEKNFIIPDLGPEVVASVKVLPTQKIQADWFPKAIYFLEDNSFSKDWLPLLDEWVFTVLDTKLCEKCSARSFRNVLRCPQCLQLDVPDINDISAVHKRKSVFGAKYVFDPSIQKVADLDNVDWGSVVGVHWVPGGPGNAGVLCVETKDGMLVLKQGSNNTTQQYFAALFGRKLGLRMPRTIILSTKELNDIAAILEERNWSNPQDRNIRLHKLKLFSPCVMMEFVPGTALDKMPADKIHETFVKFPDIPRQIGELLAFDMIINNWDRLPLIWSNEGNLGNLIISFDGNVHGIDQQITGITSKELTDSYLHRATAVISETELKDTVGEHFMNVGECLELTSPSKLLTSVLISMQNGVAEGFAKMKDVVTEEWLKVLKYQVLSDHNDKERGARAEMQFIDLSLIGKVILLLHHPPSTPRTESQSPRCE